jgi:hypothetical protein
MQIRVIRATKCAIVASGSTWAGIREQRNIMKETEIRITHLCEEARLQ